MSACYTPFFPSMPLHCQSSLSLHASSLSVLSFPACLFIVSPLFPSMPLHCQSSLSLHASSLSVLSFPLCLFIVSPLFPFHKLTYICSNKTSLLLVVIPSLHRVHPSSCGALCLISLSIFFGLKQGVRIQWEGE